MLRKLFVAIAVVLCAVSGSRAQGPATPWEVEGVIVVSTRAMQAMRAMQAERAVQAARAMEAARAARAARAAQLQEKMEYARTANDIVNVYREMQERQKVINEGRANRAAKGDRYQSTNGLTAPRMDPNLYRDNSPRLWGPRYDPSLYRDPPYGGPLRTYQRDARSTDTTQRDRQAALERMQATGRALRAEIQSGRVNRETVRQANQAVTDYTRSVVGGRDRSNSGRDASRGRDAAPARDTNKRDSWDWREDAREKFSNRP